MREPISKSEKERVAKYESVVKKHIDKFDPIGVFPDAPDNHYDSEIREISLRIRYSSNFLEISRIVYIVMAYSFGIQQIREAECYAPAVNIVNELGEKNE